MYKNETISVTTYSDDKWIKGSSFRYDSKGNLENTTKWIKIKDEYHEKAFWFLYPPSEVFSKFGMKISEENSGYIQKIYEEDWVTGAYYVSDCVNSIYNLDEYADDISKLIINEVMALTKDFGDVEPHFIAPIEIVNYICYLIFSKKSHPKKSFSEILSRWLYGEDLENILNDDKFKKADTNVVDKIIESVYNNNVDKHDGSDKILNWMVGQVMKEARGKADPSYIKEYFKRISN